MRIEQTGTFKRAMKKLTRQQLKQAEDAIREIVENPAIGEEKKADLAGVRVHKFKMNKQLNLLAYKFTEEGAPVLLMLLIGSHENFYRDLKKQSND